MVQSDSGSLSVPFFFFGSARNAAGSSSHQHLPQIVVLQWHAVFVRSQTSTVGASVIILGTVLILWAL